MITCQLVEILEASYQKHNRPGFIEYDPISIPHSFSIKQDIEIAAFFAAILAWGQRKTIINNSRKLMLLMDNSPYEFILHHQSTDLKPLEAFVHRTFNATDLLYSIAFLRHHYTQHHSLETAFSDHMAPEDITVEKALIGFHKTFFSLDDFPNRTRKHIPTPENKSTCKRLNMYLRWMVRKDDQGVDFGIWSNISPAQLLCPLDVHVERIGKKLGLISRKQRDWQAVLELTQHLREIDPVDPVRFDLALFGMGVDGKL